MSTYKSLSTANLPDPVIDPAQGSSPEDYFNTVLYTGTGADQPITGVGFQPDWVWLKQRNTTGSHGLFDSVRGATKRLSSNLTAAEDTAAGVNSFDSDGFTLDALNWNQNNDTFVAWNWKANGSGVSNTDGSITSTVSANTESGFSIVSYTGTGATSSGVTIGHGLNSTPEFIITKKRTSGTDYGWSCWHHKLLHSTYGQDVGIWLDKTSAQNPAMWAGYTNFNSTVFSPPDLLYGNENNADYINYCFHSVEGFSKFGSYTGNGSSDGVFVYTGFRPSFVMVKRTDSANAWVMYDTARDTSNVQNLILLAESSGAEASTSNTLDIISSGFKLRSSEGATNASGGTYIYMAFAENPFKYSNAR